MTLELLEVRHQKDSDSIIEVYVEAYEKRYRVKPILAQNGVDRTVLSDLLRTLGLARLRAIIQHYLRMDNTWFVTKAHDLDTLKKNLNVVNSDLGIKQSKAPATTGLHIVTNLYCDNCQARYVATVAMNHNFDLRNLCKTCEGPP